jgi:ATP-binding cassette subfamily B protein
VSPKSASPPPAPWEVRLRSATRGRERWEAKALLKKPDLARALERSLADRAGILHVSASHVSGRVLVLYSPETPGLRVGELLRDSLKEVLSLPPPSARARDVSPLLRILRTSLPEREELATPILLSVGGQIVNILQGFSLITTVNTAYGEGSRLLQALGMAKRSSRLFFMTGLTLLLTGADLFLQYHRRRAWRRLAQETQHRLRTKLIARIETQDLEFFDRYGSGRLNNLVTQDTARVGEFVERAGDSVIEKALTVVVSGTGLFASSPRLALLILSPVPVLLLSSRFLRDTTAEHYARRGQASADFSQMLENNLDGVPVVKSFTAERREARRLHDADRRLADATFDAASSSALQFQTAHSTFYLGFSLIAGYGGYKLLKGDISLSDYNRAIFWFPHLLGSVTGAEETLRLYHGAAHSSKQLAEVLDSRPRIRSGPRHLPAAEVRGEVVFDKVSFGYDPSAKVLEKVSFRLKPGETLGIVGPTGSGKSTLLRLLLRFYEVDSGRILLDGTDIRELNLHDLRRAVGMVSQEVYLFQGTVRGNVLYGHPDSSEEQIVEALREAGADDLLGTLPGGLDAGVGESGRRLSGGERQRVAIARALLKGAPVLALDEATSHLDYETEFAVKRSIRKAAAGKSVIMIAHRLSTIRDADKIIVLERGRVREMGSHKKLLAKQGLYASLWRLQSGEQLKP